ncbi:MAG: DUF3370 domain-containing protein [Oscillatoriaceae bacterium SKW80]|nr:DUF3370 domain-containing protein [Oscillatoriaceae bacterium SKYG93]MCX8121341.1 DUF3370 domain-containing protein [Oscillatoriaceae bacterium SKW80]MDW8451983.1 DUF3370 domain-containing protein [Oscillatoriaceae cyanobacterium SKYGB_i_bin93]HIK29525.1 DUF3370 domain-containing protein [Oscillatoriaceae cyanobacterium M7585_C2015_266]
MLFWPIFPLAQIPAIPAFPPLQARVETQPAPPLLPPKEMLPPLDMVPPLDEVPPQEVVEATEIRPLPGELDSIPVFNSNSPEVVLTEGILLSTFPPNGMRSPQAHLNFPLQGRFDLFTHHIARARTQAETRTLYQGIILYNPNPQPVIFEILQGASYLTSPDALFIDLPDLVDNTAGTVFSGPGSRAMSDILRGLRQPNWPTQIVIPPGQTTMLMNLPIPVGKVVPSSNGRSTLLRLSSSAPIYVANLAMFAPLTADGSERAPTIEEWQNLLINGDLAGPRDKAPTPLDRPVGEVVYGRVAGVASGSRWTAKITDNPSVEYLSIPKQGQSISYALSTVHEITFGTNQVQSAKMHVRYPDTAYYAHGNYAIEYNLTLPLYNPSDRSKKVTISLQTPLKSDEPKNGILFLKPRDRQIFFRGTVKVSYIDERGASQTRYFHLVQRRGQKGEPLLTLNLPPGGSQEVQIDFLYPPDATPPQVLTIRTL